MIALIRSLVRSLGNAIGSVFGGRRKRLEAFRKAGGVLGFRLLQDQRVRRELGMEGEQVRHFQRLAQEARQKRWERFQALQTQDRPKAVAEFAKLQRQIAMEVLAGLDKASVLKPEQLERLRQLTWQQQGAVAFTNPLVQDALKMTLDQKAGLQAIIEEVGPRLRELQDPKSRGEDGKAIPALREQTLSRVLALLDEEQKARWEQLKGRHVEIDLGGPAAARQAPAG
jgi:hypothetical protein